MDEELRKTYRGRNSKAYINRYALLTLMGCFFDELWTATYLWKIVHSSFSEKIEDLGTINQPPIK